MRVLIFGAAGKMGTAVVRRAISAGHDVTAVVRGAGEGVSPNARVMRADASNRAEVDAAMRGQEAVINTIGGKTPWKDTMLETSAANAIIASMKANGMRRLLVTSMLGVGESKQQASLMVRLLVPTFLRGANKDKSAMEAAVRSSGLDWTILRPAILNDGVATGDVRIFREGTHEKAHKIAREDVATFLVDQLVSNTYLHKTLTIANT